MVVQGQMIDGKFAVKVRILLLPCLLAIIGKII